MLQQAALIARTAVEQADLYLRTGSTGRPEKQSVGSAHSPDWGGWGGRFVRVCDNTSRAPLRQTRSPARIAGPP